LLVLLAIAFDQFAPSWRLNPVKAIRLAIFGGSASSVATCGASASCWGAVVEKNGGIFARVNEPSKEEAQSGAMSLCAQRVGPGGCRVIGVLSKKECWALAEGPSSPPDWPGANCATLDGAKSTAQATCAHKYG